MRGLNEATDLWPPQNGSVWWHPDRRGYQYEVLAAGDDVVVVTNGLKDEREVIWIDREIWPGEWRRLSGGIK